MHPSIHPEMLITDIPATILYQLADHLDIPDGNSRPYWKSLIAVLPGTLYTDLQINKFSLEGLRMNGASSALMLLRDLGTRHAKTVRQLISYLQKLHYESALLLIKGQEPLCISNNPLSSSVVAGDVARFSCKARGFPYPRYQWYRAFTSEVEGGDIIYEAVSGAADAMLEISSVEMDHAGGYCCKVYHIHSGQESSTFTEWAYLTVLPGSPGASNPTPSGQVYAAPVIRQEPDSKVRIDVGRELTLTCRASGCPKPQYQWYKYEENPKTGVTEKEPLRGCTSEVLQYAQATVNDSGQYICHAFSKAGEAWGITVSVTVQTMAQSLRRRCRIEIMRHPIGMQCLQGMDQKLECVASCATAELFYQWFKDDQPMEGQKTSQLCLRNLTSEDAATYFCRVTAENGQFEDSQKAALNFFAPAKSFTATDKVALLIGNEAYRTGVPLAAPGNDMEKLATELFGINFKVVSLLNLSLAEMRKALKIFCSLLNVGVYGLFYFSGHGFEQNGQTYMVPADAPTGYMPQECMCAEEVLESMQGKNTSLNVILLDICRKFNEYAEGPVQQFKPIVKGNTVFGYAAQCNSEAYEVRSLGYAIFTKYLVKRIHEDISIYLLIISIMEDVKKDPDAGNKQFPAVMGDLTEPRSLMDNITYTGHTVEFSTRSIAWKNAHELPGNILIDSLPLGMVADIQFESRFSNVMLINTRILNKGVTQRCEASPTKFPLEVDFTLAKEPWNMRNESGEVEEMQSYKATIENIHRIRDDFTFVLVVTYDYQGQRYTAELPIGIDRPLIAQVWLMDDQLDRAPTENEEYSDSTTNSLT